MSIMIDEIQIWRCFLIFPTATTRHYQSFSSWKNDPSVNQMFNIIYYEPSKHIFNIYLATKTCQISEKKYSK